MENRINDKSGAAMSEAVRSLLARQERLVREEFERKFQELAVEVKRQRKKYNEQVEDMKKQLSDCICRHSGQGG